MDHYTEALLANSELFSTGFKIGLVIGIPIALWVGYKLARRLGLF